MATILIVDDLSANRDVLVTLLRYQGHRLLEAADGCDGLAAARAERPDLVITDVLMPVMDGFEFVRQLHLDPTTRRIPVIFYTAHYGEREARALALSGGVSYVLTKPVDPEDVLTTVGRALAGESATALPPDPSVLTTVFDREHLRLLTDKLSEKAGNLRAANARLRALINIGLAFASERDPDRRLQTLCASARDLFAASDVTLAILDQHDRTVQRVVSCGADSAPWAKAGDALSGILATVVADRRPWRGDKTSGDVANLPVPLRHPDVQGYLAVPIASPAHVYGWIGLVRHEGSAFSDDDEHLVAALCGQVGRIYELEQEILDRRRAESALRHERDRAQRYLDTAGVIMLALDLDGRITLMNRQGCELLGWTEGELLGRDWIDTCLRDRIRDPGRQAFDSLVRGDLSTTENTVLTRSGEERLIEWRNRPLRDDGGRVIGTFSAGTDVTERNQAVGALRAAEERMRFALEASGVGIWDVDYTTGVVQWSETLEAQYGLPPGTFSGTFEAFVERIHPDDRASVLETVAQAMTSGADFSIHNRTIGPDGTVRWLSGAGRIHLGARGEPVRGVGISQDVTERRQAEATLRQSEMRKAAVLDSVLDCIVTMNADGIVIEFNAAAERTFRYTKAEAIGRSLADLIIPPTLRAAHTAGLARYLATGEGPLLGKLIEIPAVRSDGSEIPMELAITAIHSDEATIFTGVLRDITARKQADETRARLAAIVESSDDAIFSMTLDKTILTWNAGAERLYGYAASDVLGRSRALLVPVGKDAELTPMMDRAARGEPGEPFETQHRRKDGSLVDISLTISPMTDDTGRVTGVSTIARDITNRKKAEAELARLSDEIQLQRLRVFKATMRTVQDIVNNLFNGLQFVHLEAEGRLPPELLTLVDRMIQEAAVKLKTLGDLETVAEKEMAIGLGIEYPSDPS